MKTNNFENKTLIIVFSLISLFSCQNKVNTDSKVKVHIEYIRCQWGTKTGKSLLKVKFDSKLYNVPITKSYCKTLSNGQAIELYYSKKKEKIYYEK